MLFALAAAFAADPLPRFEYARIAPLEGAATRVEEDVGYRFSEWSPGQTLHAAVGTGLRAEPAEAAPSVLPVAAGDPLVVVSVGYAGTVANMRNLWYRVRAGQTEGWIFGADLTPYAFAADLDGDGDTDVATVSFTADPHIRVRVGDHVLDLETVGGGYLGQQGSGVDADLVPAARVGIPLLHLRTGVEACADFAEYWVSFGASGPVLAHRDIGLVDPPNCFTFEPAYKRGKLVMTYTKDGCADDVRPTKRRAVYRLVDGVFVKDSGE